MFGCLETHKLRRRSILLEIAQDFSYLRTGLSLKCYQFLKMEELNHID